MTADHERFVLVLEFRGDSPQALDRVIALEAKLEEKLRSGVVDGNDVGQGIVNLFIHTTAPEKCFDEAAAVIAPQKLPLTAAAYRPIQGGAYVRLWPEGDVSPFELR